MKTKMVVRFLSRCASSLTPAAETARFAAEAFNPSKRPIRRLGTHWAAGWLGLTLGAGCFSERFEYGNPSVEPPEPMETSGAAPAPSVPLTPTSPSAAVSDTSSTGSEAPSYSSTSTQPGDSSAPPQTTEPPPPSSGGSADADAGVIGEPQPCLEACAGDASSDCASACDETSGDTTSGCGQPDCKPSSSACPAGDAACEALRRHLVHRYSFDGTGQLANDSAGDADGRLVDTELDGSGQLRLDGNRAHVVLPSGIISSLDSATFESWVYWEGGDTNQRLFNFGELPSRGDAPRSYLSLTPSGSDGTLRVALRTGDAGSRSLEADVHLATGQLQHLAFVIDADAGAISLYLDGEPIASESTPHELARLRDDDNFLGRPLYDDYPYFHGRLDEFRIYDTALDPEQLQRSIQLGADGVFVP